MCAVVMAGAQIYGKQHRTLPLAPSPPNTSILTLILLFLSSAKHQTATGVCSTAPFNIYFNKGGAVPVTSAFIPPPHIAPSSTQFSKYSIHGATRIPRRRSRGWLGVGSAQRRRCQVVMANPEGTQQLRDRDLEFMFYDEADVRHAKDNACVVLVPYVQQSEIVIAVLCYKQGPPPRKKIREYSTGISP